MGSKSGASYQRKCHNLGTDGFGRSDTREALRRFFEVDRHYIALSALRGLKEDEKAEQLIEKYKN